MQCFCEPAVEGCVHCAVARKWIDREVYTLANELGGDIPMEDVRNWYMHTGPDDEPVFQEVYQWWLVSEWLHDKLLRAGEPVAYYKDLYFWGRTICGQELIVDGTFQAISRGING